MQTLVREDWSPEQVAGWLRRHRELAISYETIYRYIWADKAAGGTLYTHLRGARKQRRKRLRALRQARPIARQAPDQRPDPRRPTRAPEWAIGKRTPCWVPARPTRAC